MFCIFTRHFFVRVSRTDLYVPEDHFEEKHLVWEYALKLQPFLDLSRKLLNSRRQLFGSVIKIAVFVPEGQIDGNFILKKRIFALKIFGLQGRSFRTVGENFWQFRQICILCVQKTFWIKVYLLNKIFPNRFRSLSKTYSDACRELFGHDF